MGRIPWVGIVLVAALAFTSQALARGGPLPPIDTSHANRCDFLDPANCLYPWPNDHFTRPADTATGRQVSLKTKSMPANRFGSHIDSYDYNWADGFSAGQSIITKVPGLDSRAALLRSGAVPINDIGAYKRPGAPVIVLDADTGKRWPIFSEIDAQADDPDDRTLIIRPAENFAAGHRYIVALRNLKETDGTKIPAQPGFRYYRDDVPSDNPAIESRRPHFESIFRTLGRAGIHRQSLYLAWDFTVESDSTPTKRVLFMRDNAFNQLGDSDLSDLAIQGDSPQFHVTFEQDFKPCGHDGCQSGEDDHLLRLVKGNVTVPCYLDQPGCPPGSRFDLDANGMPQRLPGNTIAANLECIIPRSAKNFRLRPALYGHGLLGNASEVESGKLQQIADEGHDIICATDWIGLSGGDAGNVLSVLQDVSRFPTMADRMQQGMLDFLYLGRAMIHSEGFSTDPAFQVDGHSVIRTKRLYYVGGSQGGIMGGALTAIAPDFRRAYLGVPGMNYSTLLERSVDFDSYASGDFGDGDTGLGLYDNYPDQLVRPLILSLMEMLWERGEANGYAHRMTTDPLPDTPTHQVLLQEAFGDHQVTNIATEVEARTIGAHVRAPLLDPGRSRDDVPLWGIPRINGDTYRGPASMSIWDVGPLRMEGGEVKGTPPPPLQNVPNRKGVDPHGPDASETVEGQTQIGDFLRTGLFVDTCDDHPCYLDGYTGP